MLHATSVCDAVMRLDRFFRSISDASCRQQARGDLMLRILARAQAAASMTHRLAPERTIKWLPKKQKLTGSGQASAAAVEEDAALQGRGCS